MKHHIIQAVKAAVDEVSGQAFKDETPYSAKGRIFYEERYSTIFSLFPPIKSSAIGLEIGLSGGILAFTLKKLYSLDVVYTLEHPQTCRNYKKSFLSKLLKNNIILKEVDLRVDRLPWPDNFFDYIIFSEVMEHMVPADIPPLFLEIKRVLKKRGWFLVTTPNVASLLKRINLLRGKNPVEYDLTIHHKSTYGHLREYTMSEVVKTLQNTGFVIDKSDYFMIDVKRSLFTRIEDIGSKIMPFLANNLAVFAQKVYTVDSKSEN